MDTYEILDNLLFIGGQPRNVSKREKQAWFEDFRIHTVVQATGRGDPETVQMVAEYIKVNLLDTRPLPEDKSQLWAIARVLTHRLAAKSPVLIFCSAAKNRAPFMACLTLICQGWRPREAVAHLKERRPGCLTFSPFVEYLESLE